MKHISYLLNELLQRIKNEQGTKLEISKRTTEQDNR